MTTRDEIIAMAAEAGIGHLSSKKHGAPDMWLATDEAVLMKFAALAIARDRQRLAAGVDFPEITHFPCDRRMGYTLDQLRDYGDRRAVAERERCKAIAYGEEVESDCQNETDDAYNLAIHHVVAAIDAGSTS